MHRSLYNAFLCHKTSHHDSMSSRKRHVAHLTGVNVTNSEICILIWSKWQSLPYLAMEQPNWPTERLARASLEEGMFFLKFLPPLSETSVGVASGDRSFSALWDLWHTCLLPSVFRGRGHTVTPCIVLLWPLGDNGLSWGWSLLEKVQSTPQM